MLKHHTDETKAATGILLVCGSILTYLSHRWGPGRSPMTTIAAAAGPLAIVLGIGNAIHGRAMPPTHITLPARIWGLLGSIVGSLNLWWLGFFHRQGSAGRAAWLMPLALVVAWLLPSRFYRGHSHTSVPDLSQGTRSSEPHAFLDDLEKVGERHSELFDTDVREQLWAVIERKYVKLDHAYEIPQSFGMFSEAGNSELRAVLVLHLAKLIKLAQTDNLDSGTKRLDYLQNVNVRSKLHGYSYDEFIGAP